MQYSGVVVRVKRRDAGRVAGRIYAAIAHHAIFLKSADPRIGDVDPDSGRHGHRLTVDEDVEVGVNMVDQELLRLRG